VAGSERDWRNQFRQTLPECGLHPLLVRTGAEAVDLAHLVTARLVILDVRSAVRESMQACARIRGIPAYASIPIIMLISGADSSALEAGRQAGGSRFVSIPISIFAMRQEILSLLGVTPKEPAAYAEWKRRVEPSPAFGEAQAFIDARNVLDVYHRDGVARNLRQVTLHR
jgi:CheY-like chemotaxis protein